jgi:hypothetical protein
MVKRPAGEILVGGLHDSNAVLPLWHVKLEDLLQSHCLELKMRLIWLEYAVPFTSKC